MEKTNDKYCGICANFTHEDINGRGLCECDFTIKYCGYECDEPNNFKEQ